MHGKCSLAFALFSIFVFSLFSFDRAIGLSTTGEPIGLTHRQYCNPQEGAFELDLKGWSRKEDQMIPAQR